MSLTYCGLVFHSFGYEKSTDLIFCHYSLSTGPGTSEEFPFYNTWSGFRDVNCSAADHDHTPVISSYRRYYNCYTPCDFGPGTCPRGWGNEDDFYSYQSGCKDGSYYPLT